MTTNFRIVGLDEDRPPAIQRMPCIDLFFELNEQAPKEWCALFSARSGKPRYPVKISPEDGLFVETWVRTSSEIESSLVSMKSMVASCNEAYDEIQNAKVPVVAVTEDGPVISPEQTTLNNVVAGLTFDEKDPELPLN